MSHETAFTAPQVHKFLETFKDFPAWRIHQIGFPLFHLVAECLRDPEYRLPNLRVLRQALRLPCKIEEVWATIDWSERQPAVRDGDARIGRPANKYRTVLARLWPADLGFGGLPFPTFAQAQEQAISFGYQEVPQGAFSQLMAASSRFNPPGPVAVLPRHHDGEVELRQIVVRQDGHLAEERFSAGILTSDSSIAVAISTTPLPVTR